MGLEILEKIPDSACCASVLRYEGNRREEALSQDLNPLKKTKQLLSSCTLYINFFFGTLDIQQAVFFTSGCISI